MLYDFTYDVIHATLSVSLLHLALQLVQEVNVPTRAIGYSDKIFAFPTRMKSPEFTDGYTRAFGTMSMGVGIQNTHSSRRLEIENLVR